MNRHTPTRFLLALLAVLLGVGVVTPARADVETSSRSMRLVFEETFDRGPVSMGKWPGSPYAARFATYANGAKERGVGPAVFSTDALTVHDGVLDLWAYKRRTAAGTWEPVASAVIPKIAGAPDYTSRMRYGRYEWKLGHFPEGSDGMAGWHNANILWPDTGRQADGEIDWPEGRPGSIAQGNVHKLGPRPWETCRYFDNVKEWFLRGWHTYAIEWRPTGFVFYRDGVEVARESCAMPTVNMHQVIQVVTLGNNPSGNSHGHTYVDDWRIWELVG